MVAKPRLSPEWWYRSGGINMEVFIESFIQLGQSIDSNICYHCLMTTYVRIVILEEITFLIDIILGV